MISHDRSLKPGKKIFLVLLLALLFSPSLGRAASMLIYGPTAGCYADSTAGFTVTVWDAATWVTKTTADFAAFNVIVFADCSGGSIGGACFSDPTIWSAAISTIPVWSPAVTGNVLLIGSDPDYHIYSSGVPVGVVQNFVNFAGSGTGTGLYVALSCVYSFATTGTAIPLLAGLGTFTAESAGGCSNAAHKVAVHPALTGVTDTMLSNWTCSVHEGFDAWPSTFIPLAIATDSTIKNFVAADGSNGLVYILASGSLLAPVPSATPTNTATVTPTLTPTMSFTFTNTYTPSYTASYTFTPTYTPTFTYTPTITPTPTNTLPPGTNTFTPLPTNTFTPTYTPTFTYTPTPSYTLTLTKTPTITRTPTITFTPTNSFTATPNVDLFVVNKNIFSPSKDGPVSIHVGYSQYGGEYSLRIYNTAGEHIKTLDSGRPLGRIDKTYTWDGTNKNGDVCASGVYIIYLVEPYSRKVKRLILVK